MLRYLTNHKLFTRSECAEMSHKSQTFHKVEYAKISHKGRVCCDILYMYFKSQRYFKRLLCRDILQIADISQTGECDEIESHSQIKEVSQEVSELR